MVTKHRFAGWVAVALACTGSVGHAQFAGRRGFGGVRENTPVLNRYDKNGDGMLNARERAAALTDYGFDVAQVPPGPAIPSDQRLSPAQVKTYGNEALYDPLVLRTIFLSFDSRTWEDELAVFKNSDVKVPATLVVDGKTYRDVGVSFRGQTSFMMVSAGQKRSMNIDVDFRNKDQRVLGNRRLTLLNSAGDPSFLRSVMYMHIARDYYPAFKANYMRVVINGENWGVYVNQQPADQVYAHTSGGATGPIWKVPGTPSGRAGLEYLGDDPAPYQALYELNHRGGQTPAQAWNALIRVCKVLNQTAPDKLAAALEPLMDVDNALRFLAVDNALMNSDGYWSRASDYNLYMDSRGRLHFANHDANETMREEEGGWRRRGPNPAASSAGRMALDPLAGAEESDKALLFRLLAVPEFRRRYLGYVRDVNNRWLIWERFAPVAMRYQALIADDVRRDIHKLYSTDAFINSLTVDSDTRGGGMMGPTGISLKSFVERRHDYLMTALERQPLEKPPLEKP